MTELTDIRTDSLADRIIDAIPSLNRTCSQDAGRATVHQHLEKIASSIHAEGFALLKFGDDGSFKPTLALGHHLRELATVPTAETTLLLRFLAAAHKPLSLTPAHSLSVREVLERRDLAWIVAVPARTQTRARGVLLFGSASGDGPSGKGVARLAALSSPLTHVLAVSQPSADMTYKDPLKVLRAASRTPATTRTFLPWFKHAAVSA